MQAHRLFKHAILLWTLLVLFGLRVLAQLVQYTDPVGFLPSFERWQGSGLSYPVLLGSQLVIVAVLACVALRLSRGRLAPRRELGVVLLIVGGVYFGVMALRLVLGLALLTQWPWFAKSLPAFFHMVLAGYILVIGHYHWASQSRRD